MRPLLFLFLAGCAAAPTAKPCGGRVDLHNIWTTLAARYDKDGDGRITNAEFTRGPKQFANHDRDGDGVITAADYPKGRFWNGFGPFLARRLAGEDQTVTKDEWQAFVDGLDADKDGVVTGAEFAKKGWSNAEDKAELLALSFDQDGSGVIEVSDFASLFADMDRDSDGKLIFDEFRGNRSLLPRPQKGLPKVGRLAPDFELPRSDDPKQTVRLSSFRGKRPVALIFGSYT